MPDSKTNLLGHLTSSRFGLGFLYVTVIALGLALLGMGAMAFISDAQQRARDEAAKHAFRAGTITAAVSNEKANPSSIALYLNDEIAGAIHENGQYSPTEQQPSTAGPMALLFLNPTNTPLPTTVTYQAQRIAVSTDHGVVKLEGQAPDAPTRARATVVAASAAGVKAVDNRLTLPPATVVGQLSTVQ